MTVDVRTGEITTSTSITAAHRAESIRRGIQQLVKFRDLVATAHAERDWIALGYKSWDAYIDGEFGEHRLHLSRTQRLEITAALRETGMSTRAIGSALGTSKSQVARDLSGVPDGTPDDDNDQPTPSVIGLDGKTYTPPAPKSSAPPVPSKSRTDVVLQVNKALDSADKAASAADQISRAHLRQRNEEAAVWVGRLSTSLESLQRLHDALTEASA